MDPRLKNTKKNYETKRTQEKFCATLLWAKNTKKSHGMGENIKNF